MAGPSETDAPPLPDIVQRVDERSLTLTLYNADVDRSVLRDIQSYFEVQTVDLRRATTDDARPRNFVVLHDGDEFVAGDGPPLALPGRPAGLAAARRD